LILNYFSYNFTTLSGHFNAESGYSIILTIFLAVLVYDDPYLKLDHLTKKDGLTSNYILDLYQDKEGYIWVATVDGLNKYNGYTFETHLNIPGDSTSLSSNLVTSLAEDYEGNILVGTQKGLNIYNKNTDSFSKHLEIYNYPDTLSQSNIRAIYPDNSLTWIETADGLLIKTNTSTGEMNFYRHRKPTMVNTYIYHTIIKDSDDKLWLGGRYMGLFSFNPKTEQFHQLYEDPNDNTKKRDNDVAVYFEDSDGTFWVGGTEG